jgi:hypothetical protein
MKTITIKLLKIPKGIIAFSIFDQLGNAIAYDVPKVDIINGVSYLVKDNVTNITLKSIGDCVLIKTVNITTLTDIEYAKLKTVYSVTGCLWRHLTNNKLYNTYFGVIRPYILEYPFSFKNQDEIVQNLVDYTKAYKYLGNTSDSTAINRIETNSHYFNKAILYNGQQSTGLLELVEKKVNNLSEYVNYPIFNRESKTILFTKSDNFYQYNTFWAINKSSQDPLFLTTCSTSGVDKFVNQDNMDYGTRSFKKAPLRAKELKVRHILDNTSDIHLVSQFLYTPAQISYK